MFKCHKCLSHDLTPNISIAMTPCIKCNALTYIRTVFFSTNIIQNSYSKNSQNTPKIRFIPKNQLSFYLTIF